MNSEYQTPHPDPLTYSPVCRLAQVYELLITQLHIFNILFLNVLSFYRCIHYLVFHTLFPSISFAVIDYTSITSVSEYSKSIRLLYIYELKFLIMVSYTIFTTPRHVHYPQNTINVQENVSNTTCEHLFAYWHICMYLF